ncbi:MAG: hypothetical protein GF381_04280 [Candidatus Pacebacteria bacterium]|nr:hypothetical protein [Candidatus Paceibacterota bacterium]
MTKVKVITAVELSKANLKKITQAVEKKYGSDAQITTEVDPGVIGGVRLVVDYLKLDGTVASKIDSLKEQLLESN